MLSPLARWLIMERYFKKQSYYSYTQGECHFGKRFFSNKNRVNNRLSGLENVFLPSCRGGRRPGVAKKRQNFESGGLVETGLLKLTIPNWENLL
jgi:hypothetical protein